jgi:hypothetical protein
MSDILLHNAIAKGTRDMRYDILGEPVDPLASLSKPFDYANWPAALNKIPTVTTNICVYDAASGYFRCGGACTWTVPAGVTKARFELWGAGAGSVTPTCCGHAPTGMSGAYASVCMTVAPGQVYTLCAGSASTSQAYCTQGTDVSGCASYVTGSGLTNFCAMGGCASLLYQMAQMNSSALTGGIAVGCCKFAGQGYGGSQSGGGICASGFGGICTGTYPPGTLLRSFIPGTTFYGTATNATVQGIKAQHSALMWDINIYGCECSYPMIKPDGTVSSPVCDSWSSGTCCGARCAACTGAYLLPGHGGFWTHAMGGSTGVYGDWGRTGMVKVSY